MEGNILQKERTQTINNKIKLHILGVPIVIVSIICTQLNLGQLAP